MKLYGYKDEGLSVEQIEPSPLAEVTLVATPVELREIANFIPTTADEIDV